MKSPHTHMSPSLPRKQVQQEQQEQYEQYEQQDDVVDPFHRAGGGGGGSVSSSASAATPPRGGSASASLLSMSGAAAGRRRTRRLTPPRPVISPTPPPNGEENDDVGSVVSGVSGVSIGGNSASAAAARRKMRKSMQQARMATGRSQAVLGAGAGAADDNSTQGSTAATAETTITSTVAGNIAGSTQYYNALSDASPRHGAGPTATSTPGRGSGPGSVKDHGWLARERTGSAGSSSGGRPPLSPPPSSKNVLFTDDHSAGNQSMGSDDFNSFDAFGLDSRDIDKEVNAALGDLVGSHPDLGFFLDQRSSRSMSSSFGGGSTASPHPGSVRSSSAGGGSAGSSAKGTYGGSMEDLHQTISPEGDAVGPLPFNSPVVSTDHHSETSSVTCSSHGQGQGGPGAQQQQQQPRSNQFKEAAMANSRTRRIVRPGQFDGKSPIPPRHTGGSVHDRLNGLQAEVGVTGLRNEGLPHDGGCGFFFEQVRREKSS